MTLNVDDLTFYLLFWPYSYYACAETAIYEFSVKSDNAVRFSSSLGNVMYSKSLLQIYFCASKRILKIGQHLTGNIKHFDEVMIKS